MQPFHRQVEFEMELFERSYLARKIKQKSDGRLLVGALHNIDDS